MLDANYQHTPPMDEASLKTIGRKAGDFINIRLIDGKWISGQPRPWEVGISLTTDEARAFAEWILGGSAFFNKLKRLPKK